MMQNNILRYGTTAIIIFYNTSSKQLKRKRTHVIESSGKIRLVRMQVDEENVRNSTCQNQLHH